MIGDSFGMSAVNQMNKINNQLLSSMQKASSGKRINSSSDDPSGYFASKLLEKRIKLEEVKAKNLERERNVQSTNSSRLDTALELVEEIEALSAQAGSSAIGDSEKKALQNQINALTDQLDTSLKDSGLGSASELGLNNMDILSSESSRQNVIQSAQNAFNSLLSDAADTGTNVRQINRKINSIKPAIINLKSSLSTIQDADLASESINQSQLGILQKTAIESIKASQDVNKSQLDLFA